MSQTNQVFIVTFLIIILGFLLKHFQIIPEKDGKVISKFMMHTTFPALMFISMVRVKLAPSLLLISALCIVFCVLMLLISRIWYSDYPNHLKGILLMATGASNVGLFGFPLIEGLFGKPALGYAVMYDIGNTIMVFGIAYPIGSYFSENQQGKLSPKKILKKIVLLPPMMGMIVGLTINLLGVPLPNIATQTLETLAQANKALVLLLMGIYLSFELNKSQLIAISKVLLMRYITGIIFAMTIYYFLPDSTMRSVLIVCVLLPLGMTILPFSDEFNYDSRIAGTLLNISLIISFVLIWAIVLRLHLAT